METRYGLYSQGSSGWTSMRNGDLQEEDIWGVVLKQTKDSDSNFITTNNSYNHEPFILTKRTTTATRMIPKPKSKPETIHQQHSAPVNVPDWSKIYGKSSSNVNSSSWLDTDANDDSHGFAGNGFQSEEEEEDDDNEGNFIPPHEWIARRQISSFSVCEGVGRTLKGRDLSRVRNAVLIRTGFLES